MEKMRADFPIAAHGVSLSIADPNGLDFTYLKNLKKFFDRIDPLIVSDHLCWTGIKPINLHDLLPIPFTEDLLVELVKRVDQVQSYLGRQILLENVSSYLRFGSSQMSEWEFLANLVKKSGCGLLLDLNNLYVNCQNHRFSPYEFLDGLPKESIQQIHLAGFSDKGSYLFDTHSQKVFSEVWQLYRHLTKEISAPVIIEWDENIPGFSVLEEEVVKAKNILKENREQI